MIKASSAQDCMIPSWKTSSGNGGPGASGNAAYGCDDDSQTNQACGVCFHYSGKNNWECGWGNVGNERHPRG